MYEKRERIVLDDSEYSVHELFSIGTNYLGQYLCRYRRTGINYIYKYEIYIYE